MAARKRKLNTQLMRASEARTPKAEKAAPERDSLYVAALADIEAYERRAKAWSSKGKKVVKLYKNEKGDGSTTVGFRYNVLWATVQTLTSAVYARDPQPDVSRRFKDPDRVSRVAAEALERSIVFSLEQTKFGACMRRAVQDRLLPGRGTCWARYEPLIEVIEKEKPEGAEEAPPPDEKLAYERAALDYVYWEDFGHSLERDWEDVGRVWRWVYLSRRQCIKRFGEQVGKEIPLDHAPREDGREGKDASSAPRKARLAEVWDKDAGQVYFISKGYDKAIDPKTPEKTLEGFFPCPAPLFATQTTDSLIPVPDYTLYQDQARQIEDLTRRIYSITDSLKVAGIYDGAAPAVGTILQAGKENILVPVDSYAVLKEKGGLKGIIEFLPLAEIAAALVSLHEAKEQAKQDYYEITGIADIIRGNSDPRETATAQQIKGRFAALRLSDTQTDVQRFARDAVRLLGEIIAEQFSLETIKTISGLKLMTQAEKQQAVAEVQQAAAQGAPVPPELQKLLEEPTWEEVYALLQDNCLRGFRIDIETDSTVRMDEDQEKADRMEFLNAAGNFLSKAQEVAAASPAMRPLMAEMLLFSVRGFKTARSLESAFETALKGLEQEVKQPKPDPEMEKVKAQVELEREKAQLAAQTEQAVQAAQAEQARQQAILDDQRAEREASRTAQLEQQQAALQAQVDREKSARDAQTKITVERIKGDIALQVEQIRARTSLATNDAKLQADGQARAEERAVERADTQEQHTRRDNTLAEVRSLLSQITALKETT